MGPIEPENFALNLINQSIITTNQSIKKCFWVLVRKSLRGRRCCTGRARRGPWTLRCAWHSDCRACGGTVCPLPPLLTSASCSIPPFPPLASSFYNSLALFVWLPRKRKKRKRKEYVKWNELISSFCEFWLSQLKNEGFGFWLRTKTECFVLLFLAQYQYRIRLFYGSDSSSSKFCYDYIKGLGLNFRLYQKLISILIG